VLDASEYLISYRYIVKDLILYNESLQVSRAMKKCDGQPQNYVYLSVNNEDALSEIIQNNSDEFVDFIHRLRLDVEHKEVTKNAQNFLITILTLKTRCFKVDINQNLAKITALK
jgi:curli biogenesis system outer membrane secretion channel CsgG